MYGRKAKESVMSDRRESLKQCNRILVIMPRLLGETVMATAALHAIRQAHPEAHITALIKRKLRPVLYGLDSVDRVISVRKKPRAADSRGKPRRHNSAMRLGRRLSRRGFDMAIILPNSFKAAALAAIAGIPRRVGYEREGSGVLLTDRLVTRRHRGTVIPVPALDSYLGIARYLGAHQASATMHQKVHPDADARLTRMLADAGVDPHSNKLVLVNLGAPTAARRWSPRRMAHLCELLAGYDGLIPVVTAAPGESDAIEQMKKRPGLNLIDLPELGTDLHLLKAMAARSRMMVTNDAGPRYLALAMGVPLVTLIGPTASKGPVVSAMNERQVVADGLSIAARDDPEFEGTASLDRLHVDKVFDHARDLYERTRPQRVEAEV